ncbi:hypothetical protein PLESTM_000012300 [Pleodorina starrii]|nr:hypothetical protein PLESTM_000012300 [Pleodorina starrii]
MLDDGSASPQGATRCKPNPDKGIILRCGSFDMSGSDLRFDGFVANCATQIADMPMAAGARSALSTPGSQQGDSPQPPADKPAASAAASDAPADPESASTPAAPESASTPAAPESASTPAAPESASTPAAPESASTPAAPESASTPADPESPSTPADPEPQSMQAHDAAIKWLYGPSPTPLFKQHDGVRSAAANPKATVPPHRLSLQLQLCLRHAYDPTASAEWIVQAAPEPYMRLSEIGDMSEHERVEWIKKVERAWYCKLLTKGPWKRHTRLATSHTDALRPQLSMAPYEPPTLQPQTWSLPSPSPAAADMASAHGTQVPTTVYVAHPPAATYGPAGAYYPQQPVGAQAYYPQQPVGAQAYYPQQPVGAQAYYPQQPVGAQAYYPQQPVMGPMQPVVMGNVQPSPMGPMQQVVMVSPMQQVVMGPAAAAAWPSPATHGPVPVSAVMPVSPMMGAVGNPHAVGGGGFYYPGSSGGGNFMYDGRTVGGNRWGYWPG